MGLTLTLTDAELPASPAYIEFLHATLSGNDFFAGEWYAQEEESLASNSDRFTDITEKARLVSRDPRGNQYLVRSYRFFKELLTGNMNTLRDMQRFHFYFIIGIPRTGGTYLTKQLFRASDIDYRGVQNALAHDGFPHLANLSLKENANLHTNGLLQLAEYLTMVEIYFSRHGKRIHGERILVPKKFTKAVYYFDLIRELFSDNADFLITLRHPLAVCKSVLDKSGGMPEGGRFAVRSAIERWALNDWLYRGRTEQEVLEMDYVDCMLGYWKRFHFQIAMAGIPAMPGARLVPYGSDSMTATVREYFTRFGVSLEPEAFVASPAPSFPPRAREAADATLEEVNDFWSSMDMEFPLQQVAHPR